MKLIPHVDPDCDIPDVSLPALEKLQEALEAEVDTVLITEIRAWKGSLYVKWFSHQAMDSYSEAFDRVVDLFNGEFGYDAQHEVMA